LRRYYQAQQERRWDYLYHLYHSDLLQLSWITLVCHMKCVLRPESSQPGTLQASESHSEVFKLTYRRLWWSQTRHTWLSIRFAEAIGR
jgi:hypothetical protein